MNTRHVEKRSYYLRNREIIDERRRTRCRALRLEMLTAYGLVCECCGEKTIEFLTLEHKRHDGKAHRAEFGNDGVLRDLKRRGWPKEQYGLLCFNCNLATRYQTICPHQKGL